MADIKRTSEYRKLLPFIARASGDVGSDTVGEDVQALLLALNAHKTSDDHDGRYYTETEIANLFSTHSQSGDHDGRYYTETEIDLALALKADKTITLTAGNGLTGGGDLSANRTFTVGAGDGITVAATSVAVDSSVVRTSRTLTAGNGLTGGGDLSADRTFDVLAGLGIDFDVNGAVIVDLTENFNWTGEHTFTKYLSTASIYPNVSDTYDLGDYNRLWRKIWGSELSAIVFAQYTQVLLGGWFTVSKGEGIVKAAVTAAATTIDLGSNNFATNDIIVFRGLGAGNNPQIEYMKVGTLVSGTTYNVTRNLDGTGANAWADGSVYGNWGQTGNGRVELNAYDTPRMSVYSQGMSYNDATEEIRIGDLYGQWGYNTNTYGAAFGSYKSGKANITIDPTNGIRIRNYNQDVIKLTGTEASFENVIKLGTYARLEQGTGTWGSTFTGSAIWNESGVMNIGGWQNGVKQWWGGSDGKFYASGGYTIIGANSITLKADAYEANPINFMTKSGYAIGMLSGYGSQYSQQLHLTAKENLTISSDKSISVDTSSFLLYAYKSSIFPGISPKIELRHRNSSDTITRQLIIDDNLLSLTAPETRAYGAFNVWGQSAIKKGILGGTGNFEVEGNADISGDLVVNGTIKDGSGIAYLKSTGKAADSDKLDGLNSTAFGRPVFLASPLTSTTWSISSPKSSTSPTLIDMSVSFANYPATPPKALMVRLIARDSVAVHRTDLFATFGPSVTRYYQLSVHPAGGDIQAATGGIINCNANGDIAYSLVASGTRTMDVQLEIWGYWL